MSSILRFSCVAVKNDVFEEYGRKKTLQKVSIIHSLASYKDIADSGNRYDVPGTCIFLKNVKPY